MRAEFRQEHSMERELDKLMLNSGNWVHIMKKVVCTAIYTNFFLSYFVYLKLMCVN